MVDANVIRIFPPAVEAMIVVFISHELLKNFLLQRQRPIVIKGGEDIRHVLRCLLLRLKWLLIALCRQVRVWGCLQWVVALFS
jgi:hypothetical protein